ncbi:MAG: sulfotransferase, partial [Proteobacteria bacterium]|nr:sulfotransferase [Pseudomonadota bacterium]
MLGTVNSHRKDLVNFLDAIKDSQDTTQVTHYFLEFLQQQCKPGTPIVLKAADQLISLQQLQQYSPHSRKIAIIRDGRDAAISAIHYRKLMQKRDAPWAQKEEAYLGQVRGWATRARMLANWAEKNGITILRYEDLHRDFFGGCGRLFELM